MAKQQIVKLALCILVPLLLLLMPTTVIPIEGMTLVHHRILVIFVMAALFWVFEPVPVFATSLLIITLELVMVSNKGLGLFVSKAKPELEGVTPLGDLLNYTDIFSSFSSPIIILFMGGFSLAIAAAKYDLDRNLARVLLKPFGEKIPMVMLGLMLITAVFSMFMSNTATTVMMLAIVGPLIACGDPTDKGLKALVLAIPVAANTGGIATPIGTPPNAVALQYIPEGAISFGEWMAMGVPFVIVQLAIGWAVLNYFYPSKTGILQIELKGKFLKTPKAFIVYFGFAFTILLWLTTSWHGMNTYVVAILPLALFTLTGVMTKNDLKLINWDVLWLVAGGIAMGMALQKSGLAAMLANSIDFASLPVLAVIIVLSFTCYMMANFMSNTATANLLMPIAAAVATSLDGLSGGDGVTTLLLIVAVSASLGMILPVSTPPNALAYSTGLIETKDLLKVGAIVGGTGLAILYLCMLVFI